MVVAGMAAAGIVAVVRMAAEMEMAAKVAAVKMAVAMVGPRWWRWKQGRGSCRWRWR